MDPDYSMISGAPNRCIKGRCGSSLRSLSSVWPAAKSSAPNSASDLLCSSGRDRRRSGDLTLFSLARHGSSSFQSFRYLSTNENVWVTDPALFWALILRA
jgi:hypothetical protein